MKEKIYVVTKGCYSDYHIITATTDKKLAEEIAKKFDNEPSEYDRTDVEEFYGAELYLKSIWGIVFDNKGEIESIDGNLSEYCYRKDIGKAVKIYGERIFIAVEADTEEQAIKIASEKRRAFLYQQDLKRQAKKLKEEQQ